MGTRVNSKKSICPMHSIGNINANQSMFPKKKTIKDKSMSFKTK
jgi:hypothetical protein